MRHCKPHFRVALGHCVITECLHSFYNHASIFDGIVTIGDLLRRFGCSVDGVAEGNKAVEMINKKDYDLILSDIKMPGKNGYEIFAAAKDKDPDLPVILMTGFGYDPHHSIVRARKEGLAAVLFKPFKVDQLLGEIRKAIDA